MRHAKRLKVDFDENVKRKKNRDNLEEEEEEEEVDVNIKTLDSTRGNCNPTGLLAGRIEVIQMINFMCHSNLEIKFDKRLTFVTGLNGSGKSTIMIALIVALGGSANSTSRGKGLSDFIKKGEKWAKIILTLTNDGTNAYKKNLYGDRIVIIRDLTLQGGNGYTCKSKYGSVISRKKEEVDKICAALDIQIKNPICILNQDVARSFLSSSCGSSRYEMFMKATHLDKLQDIYSIANSILEWARDGIATKKEELSEANEELIKLKKNLDFVRSLSKISDERKALGDELLWALVIAEEKELDLLRHKKSDVKQMKTALEESRDNCVKVTAKIEGKIKTCEEKLQNREGRSPRFESRKKELPREIQRIQAKIDSIKEHIKNMVAKSERRQSDIKSTKKHLKQIEEGANRSSCVIETLAELKKNLSKVRYEIESTQAKITEKSNDKIQCQFDIEDSVCQMRTLQLKKDKLEEQIEQSKNFHDNCNKAGSSTFKLKELIDRAVDKKRFLKKPIGPCCNYVKLKNFKWARAVESVIGGLMETYCCDNQKDFQVLSGLMDKACGGKNPPIIISQFQPCRHNVSGKKVSVANKYTILDVLNISSDVVYNTFIDQAKIERILLVDNNEEACSLLSNAQDVPKNVRMGLTPNCDQYFPAPNFRSYFGNKRPLKYFDVDVMEDRKNLEEDLIGIELKLQQKTAEFVGRKSRMKQCNKVLKKTEADLIRLKESEKRMEVEIVALKRSRNEILQLPAKEVLEEDMLELEREEKEAQRILNLEKLKLKELIAKVNSLRQDLEGIHEMEESWEKEGSELKQQLGDLKLELRRAYANKEKIENDIKSVKPTLVRVRAQVKEKKILLKEKREAAMRSHKERIETARLSIEIEELIRECDMKLREARCRLGEEKDLAEEYRRKCRMYEKIDLDIEKLEYISEKLFEFILWKEEYFRLRQSEISGKVSRHFETFLRMRGYNGNLLFDFSNETLEMEIIPKFGPKRTNTKTLSGGERSFMMVSFILAVWRTINMPFYFLDEFDVFMDKMNRKVIMDLLIMHGERETEKQFIFITPQSVSYVANCNSVSVYRLPDPRKPSV